MNWFQKHILRQKEETGTESATARFVRDSGGNLDGMQFLLSSGMDAIDALARGIGARVNKDKRKAVRDALREYFSVEGTDNIAMQQNMRVVLAEMGFGGAPPQPQYPQPHAPQYYQPPAQQPHAPQPPAPQYYQPPAPQPVHPPAPQPVQQPVPLPPAPPGYYYPGQQMPQPVPIPQQPAPGALPTVPPLPPAPGEDEEEETDI